jgi:porin
MTICDEACDSPFDSRDYSIVPSWLDFDAAYRGETFNNARGGLDTNGATIYTGRLDLLLTGDLSKFKNGPGGTFLLHFQNLEGEGITDRYVGAVQRISNIDGNPGAGHYITQVSQYWWRRDFSDGLFTLKLGKILADSEFAINTYAGDYINTSFGWTHTLPLAAYPNPTAGVVLNTALTDKLTFKTGVFDGHPNGRNWGFSGTGDTMSLFEFRRLHSFGDSRPGDVHVGMWYHSGDFAAQNGNGFHRGNNGLYTGINQQLTDRGLCSLGKTRGLAGFVHAGWAPTNRNLVHQYWGGGLNYRGLLDSRDSDSIGVAIGNMSFSNDLLVARQDETIFESFYKARFGSHLVLQPDFQYFWNPAGLHRDSIAVGLRFEYFN